MEFLDFTKKNEKFETPEITIDENVLICKDAFYQLSNVSQVRVSPIPKAQYPIWAIICVVIGIAIMSFRMIIPGLLIGGFGAAMLFLTYQKNSDLGEYLILSLNSGHEVFFSSSNTTFLRDVVKVLINCVNNSKTLVKIDFKNCQVNNSQIGGETKIKGL